MLVLADDLTGALDTGVQFAHQNVPTLVSTRIETLDQDTHGVISVLVLDLDSRHVDASVAAERVRRAVHRAHGNGVKTFYKKTDSTLRGNIGAELNALLQAAGAPILAFVPAYPATGRLTVGGRQYVNGVPLHENTVYAGDRRNPVRSGSIREIIAEQSAIPVEVVGIAESPRRLHFEGGVERIVLFDARTDEDLRLIAERLKRSGLLRVSAGCAGFAAHLPRALELAHRSADLPDCPSRLLVVCGSINPVSLRQVERGVRSGMQRVVLGPESLLERTGNPEQGLASSIPNQRLSTILGGHGDLILQTARGRADIRRAQEHARAHGLPAPQVPGLIAAAVGEQVRFLLESCPHLAPVVFGGDTALGVMRAFDSTDIVPVAQVCPGVAVSRMVCGSTELTLITKAGGLGPLEVLSEIKRFVSGR